MKYKISIFVSIVISITLFMGSLMLTDWLFYDRQFHLLKYLVRTFLLVLSLGFFVYGLQLIIKTTKNNLVKNISVFVISLFLIFITGEICFSFYSQSCSGENVLLAKNWHNYYWKENSLGYRDTEYSKSDNTANSNLFVIGDSYAAGHGLKNVNERFSNILKEEFRNCINVFTLAKMGADTRSEFEFLNAFPVKPDFIIVAYVNNDIYNVMDRKKIMKHLHLDSNLKSHIKRFKPKKNFFTSNSFIINFIENYLVENAMESHITDLAGKHQTFGDFLDSPDGRAIEMSYYKDSVLFNMQLRNIDLFINYSKNNNVPLLFVLFPKMNDHLIDFTDKTANVPITKYLNTHDVDVINLTPLIKPLKNNQRIVSKFDPHPSATINKIVADTIKNYIIQSGLKKNLCN